MISLVSVSNVEVWLPAQSEEFQPRLDALYENGRMPELVEPRDFTQSLAYWPVPPTPRMPAPRIGMFHWPVIGASRYAFGTFLIDGYTLEQLYTTGLTADGGLVRLRFYDYPTGSETPREFPVRILSVRPLARDDASTRPTTEPAEDNAWVLTVVDTRYDQLIDTSNVTLRAPGAAYEWLEFFSDNPFTSYAFFNVTVTDTIDTDYLRPNAYAWTQINVFGVSQTWLADTAAASIGSRIVCTPAGRFLQRPTTGNRDTLLNYYAILEADDRRVAGGLCVVGDETLRIPTTYELWFASTQSGVPPTVTTVTSSYGTTGYTMGVWLDALDTTTGGQRSAMAAQWVSDYESWAITTPVDAMYAGFTDIPASGYLGSVTYFHTGYTGWTRFERAPLGWGMLPRPPKTFGDASIPGASGQVPQADGGGHATPSPMFFQETPVHGQPASQMYIYTSPTATGTTNPTFFQQSSINGGNTSPPSYQFYQAVYPQGTAGSPVIFQQIDTTTSGVPTQYQQSITLPAAGSPQYQQTITVGSSSPTIFQQTVTPTAVQTVDTIGSAILTTATTQAAGTITTTISSTGGVSAASLYAPTFFGQTFVIQGGTLTNTLTYSAGTFTQAIAGGILAYIGSLDFSGATVTGLPCCGPAPSAPTSLAATPGSGSAALTWVAPTGAPAAATYKVYRSAAVGMTSPTLLTTTASTSYTATGLTNGTTYYFSVAAVADTGSISSYSNVVSATPSGTYSTPGTYTFVATATSHIVECWGGGAGGASGGLPGGGGGGGYAKSTVTGLTIGTGYTIVVGAGGTAGAGAGGDSTFNGTTVRGAGASSGNSNIGTTTFTGGAGGPGSGGLGGGGGSSAGTAAGGNNGSAAALGGAGGVAVAGGGAGGNGGAPTGSAGSAPGGGGGGGTVTGGVGAAGKITIT